MVGKAGIPQKDTGGLFAVLSLHGTFAFTFWVLCWEQPIILKGDLSSQRSALAILFEKSSLSSKKKKGRLSLLSYKVGTRVLHTHHQCPCSQGEKELVTGMMMGFSWLSLCGAVLGCCAFPQMI